MNTLIILGAKYLFAVVVLGAAVVGLTVVGDDVLVLDARTPIATPATIVVAWTSRHANIAYDAWSCCSDATMREARTRVSWLDFWRMRANAVIPIPYDFSYADQRTLSRYSAIGTAVLAFQPL